MWGGLRDGEAAVEIYAIATKAGLRIQCDKRSVGTQSAAGSPPVSVAGPLIEASLVIRPTDRYYMYCIHNNTDTTVLTASQHG